MKDFKTAPLTASDSYSRVAGLMEATYKLMCLANTTAETMKLKKDLMLAAASVYYIGNVDMVNAEYHPTKDVALIGFDIAAHDKLVVANNQIAESERVSKEDFQIFENKNVKKQIMLAESIIANIVESDSQSNSSAEDDLQLPY